MAEVLAAYHGPAVGMSFDPDQVGRAPRDHPLARPRGIIAEHDYTARGTGRDTSPEQRQEMTHLRHFFRSQPNFVRLLGQRTAVARAMAGAQTSSAARC